MNHPNIHFFRPPTHFWLLITWLIIFFSNQEFNSESKNMHNMHIYFISNILYCTSISVFRRRHFRSRWRHTNMNFGVTGDSELNFQIKKTDLDFRHLERLWSFLFEAMFSILKLKKIIQNRPKLDIQNLFYTKSST